MSAPLSVVIPTLEAADRLGPCVGALGPGLTAGLVRELVIADGGSRDAIAEVAEALGARLVVTAPGRGTQLAAGCAASRGDWLLVLHADTRLPEGWEETVRRHIADHPARAGYFGLAFDADGPGARWTAAWAGWRSALFALPYGDQGLLVSRGLYRAAGGYPEIPLMEDVSLARRIGRRRLRRLPGRVVTSAARYEAEGWLRRGARNLSVLGLWLLGVPPARLVRRYRGSPKGPAPGAGSAQGDVARSVHPEAARDRRVTPGPPEHDVSGEDTAPDPSPPRGAGAPPRGAAPPADPASPDRDGR